MAPCRSRRGSAEIARPARPRRAHRPGRADRRPRGHGRHGPAPDGRARPCGRAAGMSATRMRDGIRDGIVVGVDIGGTKTAILVVAPDGTVLARSVAPTAVGAPDRAADAIAGLVTAALET